MARNKSEKKRTMILNARALVSDEGGRSFSMVLSLENKDHEWIDSPQLMFKSIKEFNGLCKYLLNLVRECKKKRSDEIELCDNVNVLS